jgi:hypothetical protein
MRPIVVWSVCDLGAVIVDLWAPLRRFVACMCDVCVCVRSVVCVCVRVVFTFCAFVDNFAQVEY